MRSGKMMKYVEIVYKFSTPTDIDELNELNPDDDRDCR